MRDISLGIRRLNSSITRYSPRNQKFSITHNREQYWCDYDFSGVTVTMYIDKNSVMGEKVRDFVLSESNIKLQHLFIDYIKAVISVDDFLDLLHHVSESSFEKGVSSFKQQVKDLFS